MTPVGCRRASATPSRLPDGPAGRVPRRAQQPADDGDPARRARLLLERRAAGRRLPATCIVNYRTEAEDMDALLDVASELAKLDVELRPEAAMTWWSLLGSGEFQPWSEPVDRRLLEEADGDGRVLILPTASAPEGKDVFERWGSGSRTSRGSTSRGGPRPEDARGHGRPALVEKLEGASAVYFSAGTPPTSPRRSRTATSSRRC